MHVAIDIIIFIIECYSSHPNVCATSALCCITVDKLLRDKCTGM